MDNFREMAARFDAAGAWERVADAGELGALWQRWLDDPAAGRERGARAAALVEDNRGALARTLELLGPLLVTADGRSTMAEPSAADEPAALPVGGARERP